MRLWLWLTGLFSSRPPVLYKPWDKRKREGPPTLSCMELPVRHFGLEQQVFLEGEEATSRPYTNDVHEMPKPFTGQKSQPKGRTKGRSGKDSKT